MTLGIDVFYLFSHALTKSLLLAYPSWKKLIGKGERFALHKMELIVPQT